jgi:hypothetical protein
MLRKNVHIRSGDFRKKFLRKACRTIVEYLKGMDYFPDVSAKGK